MNGCYIHGHACQKKVNKKGELTGRQKRARVRDARRYTFFLSAGYRLLVLWGCDIKQHAEAARRRLRQAARAGL